MDFGIGNLMIIVGIVIVFIGSIIVLKWINTDVTSITYDKINKLSTWGFIIIWLGLILMFEGAIIGIGNKETRTYKRYYQLKKDIDKSQKALEKFLLKHPEIKIEG